MSSHPNAPRADQVRDQFIRFFVEKAGHTAVPSSAVVPHDDPTLMFANAGMNQFKDVFLGTGSRPFTRAVDTQKCIRAGGKHNDLDDVGVDTYHHTFFEMLGNWSFGDYFKEEAIAWAWELLTSPDWWGLEPKRLHATYFEGDPGEGLEPDLEARDFWLKRLPPEQVHPGNKKDNFWEMGDTGPCGPCSELHYDGTDDLSGGPKVNADDPDVIEIWNLVFIQYNRLQSGDLQPLPAKHVDTGMGFERIVRVLQGKNSNYDTDVFGPLFTAIQTITGARAYTPGGDPAALADPINVAYRVIADHIRTLSFALADGAHCGNEGRSYVLRRILRRAVRYGRQTLGVTEPFFYKLVPAVVDNFAATFPELKQQADAVAAEIKEEEVAFGHTLDRGIALFERAASGLTTGGQIDAQDAFVLYDTHGFPLDLTQLMAAERGLTVDEAGFNQKMDEARAKSRAGASGSDDARQSLLEGVQKGLDAGWFTDTDFTGYGATESPFADNTLHLFVQHDGVYQPATQANAGDAVAVVLKATPFYAEAGGQVGDSGGIMVKHQNAVTRVKIEDTIKIGGVHLHLGRISGGSLAGLDPQDGTVTTALAVDAERRALIQNNHTATHLMNRALRDRVNDQANQKGSLVNDQRLRFDFTHGSTLSDDEIAAIESDVNRDLAADEPVYIDVVAQEQALKINGLRAVFGEKYPPKVRVVSIGVPVADLLADPDNDAWSTRSIEFCGGTHLARTGAAQAFAITSQEAVGRGVRRLTALTGDAAAQAQSAGAQLLGRAQALADVAPDALGAEVEAVTRQLGAVVLPLRVATAVRSALTDAGTRLKKLQKEAGNASQAQVVAAAQAAAAAHSGSGPLVARIADADGKSLRTAMDVIRKQHADTPMMLAAVFGDRKVALLASVPPAGIAQGLKAGDWIKAVAPVVGGGGGGKPDQAMAGGKDPEKVDDALEAARAFAAEHLG